MPVGFYEETWEDWMKKISIGFICIGLGLGVAASTSSVPSAHAAASDSVAMQLSRMVLNKSTYEAMVKQMMDSMMNASGQAPDAKTQKELTAVVMEALPYDEMLKFNAKVYGEHFKDSELEDVITFYKTPTGAKLVHELPNISGEVGQMVGKIIPERLPALLKKHGITH
ncbi:MAG TPA: DUF2059 domain-containing protein [Polyangiaceae bacterium]|nr:DUF2059 domain-containing protein [Polyangiaceae bacterium]